MVKFGCGTHLLVSDSKALIPHVPCLKSGYWSIRTMFSFLKVIIWLKFAFKVWGNTQQKEQPWEIKFDLSIKSDWFPLFKTGINLQTVQPDAILYEEPFLNEVQDFQLTLENQLRSHIMDWRMGLHTNFLIAPRREMIEILKRLVTYNPIWSPISSQI